MTGKELQEIKKRCASPVQDPYRAHDCKYWEVLFVTHARQDIEALAESTQKPMSCGAKQWLNGLQAMGLQN